MYKYECICNIAVYFLFFTESLARRVYLDIYNVNKFSLRTEK